MTTPQRQNNPEVTQAIIKYALIEAFLLAVAVVLYLTLHMLWPIFVAAVLSTAVLYLLMVQAEAIKDRDEQR